MSDRLVQACGLATTAAALARGERDPVAQADATCDRIEAVNPALRAFLPEEGRRARVRAEAATLGRSWPDAATRPTLFGVLVGVKDVVRVDGLPTGAGSDLPAEALAGAEAPVVTRLRAAGAVVAGKTVTAEFAFMAPGPTRNPHALDRSPGGSSSGSAAAVAAGAVPLALGTQTIGSVIRPAAYCGIVGFKPSYGRIPIEGTIANAPTFDTLGLFTQDVAGMVLAAGVVCDGWRPERVRSVDRPVLGVPEGPYLSQATPEALKAFEEQVARLEAAGFAVRRVPVLADIAEVNARNTVINLVELARTHEDLFAAYSARYRDETAAGIRAGRDVPAETYERALAERSEFAAGLVERMDSGEIDAWIAPAATGPAPEGITTTGSPIMNLPWTQARLPVVAVPAGRTAEGLPLGVQCVARPGADEELLGWVAGLAGCL